MDTSSIASALSLAMQHHQARRFPQAEQLYRQILQADPHNFDATHFLGVLLFEAGHAQPGLQLVQRAIQINPNVAEAHYHLGNIYLAINRPAEAAGALAEAVRIRPELAAAHTNLGMALLMLGRFEDALQASEQAIRLDPAVAAAHLNAGNALRSLGRVTDAVESHRKAVRLEPDNVRARTNFGNSLQAAGELEQAIAEQRAAISLAPNLAEAWCNLASALSQIGDQTQAISACERALQLNPKLIQAHLNLGNALSQVGCPAEGAQAYREALKLNPRYPDALCNLGNALKNMGRIPEALESYRSAAALAPNHPGAQGNVLFTMQFLESITPQEILDAHRTWGTALSHLAPDARHDNDPTPDRCIRVGFVSGDFGDHPVGRFLLPLFRQFNPAKLHISCFSDSPVRDRVADALRACSADWHRTTALTNADLATLIRSNKVDLLVDLSLHARLNRMLVFARKPAPVQVTYLAYPGTSGLTTIDYRLTDPLLDPPDAGEPYVEQSWRLRSSYWCYEVPSEMPPVGPLPAGNGVVTFGCLNNFCKVSNASLLAFGRTIASVPSSRLLLHAPPGDCRHRVMTVLASAGATPAQVDFIGYQSQKDYYATYNRIDIALDPFPNNGGTTTCDALAMGVPVITLAGNSAIARAGSSILSNANLPELVAKSADEYVRIAGSLATDLPRLAELRATLRERLRQAPLTDAPGCARAIEEAFREMWRRWCTNVNGAI